MDKVSLTAALTPLFLIFQQIRVTSGDNIKKANKKYDNALAPPAIQVNAIYKQGSYDQRDAFVSSSTVSYCCSSYWFCNRNKWTCLTAASDLQAFQNRLQFIYAVYSIYRNLIALYNYSIAFMRQHVRMCKQLTST